MAPTSGLTIGLHGQISGGESQESLVMTKRFLVLFQHISVLLLRFNSVLFDSFELGDRLEH